MFEDEQLDVSTQELIFLQTDKARSFKLINNTHSIILYKIRTNNLNAIQASPNRGYINPRNSISLLIKSKKQDEFQAMVRIAYAIDEESTGDNFSIEWSALPKKSIKNKDVRIKREINKSKQNNTYQKIDIKDNYRQQPLGITKEQQQYAQIQQQLSKQKQINYKLGQQFAVTISKLNQINKERLQIKVNKSIGIICQDFHPSMTTFMLFLLSTFVLGLLVGKIFE